MLTKLTLLLLAALGENVVVNGDFSDWPTYTGKGLTTTSVGVDRAQFLTHWYGGPGQGATATYDVVPFPDGQTAVPGSPKQHLRIAWATPPESGETQHANAFRGTFLEYFGLQDVRLFSGKTVSLIFHARIVSEDPEATLPIVPIMWHSYDPTNPVRGVGYELFESSGEPGLVAVAQGPPNLKAIYTLTTQWQRFEVPVTLPDVSAIKTTPGHYTGLGFDMITRAAPVIDIAMVEARAVAW
ncbi:MAG: hypothetical protein Q8N51_02375 [Gammaproteobacteria bacterium]|nr:hypothetical protein [Gammaproteobacteria bacterium]